MPETDALSLLALLEDRDDASSTANVNLAMPSGTLLHRWIASGNEPVVVRLIELGAEVNVTAGTELKTPLHLARTAAAVRILVEAGARLDAKDQTGSQPLHDLCSAACRANPGAARPERGIQALAALEALLEAGADPNVVSSRGTLPLELAELPRDRFAAEIVEMLLHHGADLNARLASGETVMQWAWSGTSWDSRTQALLARCFVPEAGRGYDRPG